MYKKSMYNYLVIKDNMPTLLFNTSNHALVELDDDTLLRYQKDSLTDDEIKLLIELGIYVGDLTDELNELKLRRANTCRYHPQLDITLMVTDNCNFGCPYCYQNHTPKNLSQYKTNIFCKFLSKVYKQQTHTVNIKWFGGEPLLNTKPIFQIEKQLRKLQFEGYSHMTTNGYLLSDSLLTQLKNETRIKSLQITLDGTENQHNSTRYLPDGSPTFKTICSNIVKATEHGFFVTIRVNLNKKNQNMDDFFEMLNALNLDKSLHAIHVNSTHDFDNSSEIPDFYFNSPEEYGRAYNKLQDSFAKAGYSFPRNYTKNTGCEFECNNTFLADCDLNLYFCSSCEHEDFYKQGYIDDDGNLVLNEQYVKRKDLSVFNDKECVKCILLPMCMGGCTLRRIKKQKFCIPEKYFLDDYIIKLYKEKIKPQAQN